MSQLTITVSAAQWARIQEAFTTRDGDGNPVTPTAQDMETWVLRQVKAKVFQYEEGKASVVSNQQVRDDLTAEGWP
tara:strand:- start:231 stop:458 length:228 start_codon:yes stop_codon:yes gene_type:complete